MLLTGCNTKPGYCPSPVRADNCTKEFLKTLTPLPSCAKDYLKAVGDEQQAIMDNCK
jgi:hypothetical protein